VTIWLFYTKTFTFALIMTILMMVIGLLDNILKPFLLARGLQTPIIVMLLGVLGGVLLHGVIGIFIGPVILALVYDLVHYWLS
jgi:predicted PurR-regulated permease PerM